MASGSNNNDAESEIKRFWEKRLEKIESMSQKDFRELSKHLELPLARIKKIMKIDENARSQMISSEAPILLSTAAEFLIEEMTLRAWLHTEQNRRKTIQKSDVANGVAGNEMFDFLIDIIPREETRSKTDEPAQSTIANNAIDNNQIQYVYATEDGAQLVQLPDGQVIQATQIGPSIPLSAAPGQPIQLIADGGEQYQIVPVNTSAQN